MKAKRPTFPHIVKCGSVSVTVYAGKSGASELFTLVWQEGPKRHRRAFRKWEKALAQADLTAKRLESGHRTAAAMRDVDAESFGLAIKDLAPLGVPLNVAVKEFVAAAEILKGTSLIEAARFYISRRPTQVADITVSEAVESYLLAKKSDGIGIRYLQDSRSRLRMFAKAFTVPIASCRTDDMGTWLRTIAPHPRTRNNFRRHLVTLFRWARDEGYLPREAQTEADRLTSANDSGGDVLSFRADDIAKLLEAADERLTPYLAIRAFAGVRDSEMRRLTWESVRFSQGVIEIKASQAKTAARRIIPIQPNLKAWLAPYKSKKGPISYFNAERISRRTAKEAKLPWIRNGLRHGFGSHRLAVLKDAAAVAHEMGNTETMVHRHYKELFTEAEGKAWFAIMPKRPANVIAMDGRKAA